MRTESQIRSELETLETRRRRLRKELRLRKASRIGTVIRKGRGSRDRDEELKRQRGYTDPSSYVRRDGSERLVNADWRKRVEELRERAGGRCERLGPFTGFRCYNNGRDPDHKIKRSMRRDDRMLNLEWLCPGCHDEKHPEFKPRFGEKA